MAQIIIIGNAEVRNHLRAIARSLRASGRMVSCYLDHTNTPILTQVSHVEFLLIGLSNASRNEQSPEHSLEREAIGRAIDANVSCGVVCDGNGNISASYLKDLGSKVALVVGFNTMNVACAPTELCHNAEALFVSDLVADAEKVAQAIRNMIQRDGPRQGIWERPTAPV